MMPYDNEFRNTRNMGSPYPNLPTEPIGWKALVEPAKDAYWLARRNGKSETEALLAALDVAVAAATDQ
jgi:hypothetical protein